MTSLNTLPIELIINIIDLAAEDYVIFQDEVSRRKILLNLSLVSRNFTLPSQQALWRYIAVGSFDHSRFIIPIREGLGRDKKVRSLIFELRGEGDEKELSLEYFFEVLSGINSITELDLSSRYGDPVNLPDFCEIASVKGIKRLGLYNIILQLNPETFPTTLRSLSFQDMKSAESLLSQLSLNPSAAIDTIMFDFDDYSDNTITQFKGLISYFEVHGANLRKLSFKFFDPRMIIILLPHTPSLLHLTLASQLDNISTIIKYIEALPSSTRLYSLEIGFFNPADCVEINFLLPLLLSPQLQQLESLRVHINSGYGELYEDRVLDQVKNGLAFKTGLDQSVRLCENRGVRLSFRSEEREKQAAETRKQELYRERQEELDRI